jgi:hypothetical protein
MPCLAHKTCLTSSNECVMVSVSLVASLDLLHNQPTNQPTEHESRPPYHRSSLILQIKSSKRYMLAINTDCIKARVSKMTRLRLLLSVLASLTLSALAFQAPLPLINSACHSRSLHLQYRISNRLYADNNPSGPELSNTPLESATDSPPISQPDQTSSNTPVSVNPVDEAAYPLNVPSPILLGSSIVLAIASAGKRIEMF